MKTTHLFGWFVVCCTLSRALVLAADSWQPVEGSLLTRWARQVDPSKPLNEYPRPQMVRTHWRNLNGLWDYAVCLKDAERPDSFQGKILVPFPIESAMSGVKRPVRPYQRLWYRRTFQVKDKERQGRVLLHFGAVDWKTTVWVNDTKVGTHQGGYDAFSFDITDALRDEAEQQQLIVSVWDPTDVGYQPRGKQVLKPKGIWYTAVTGIWRTVWLESVPECHIATLKITPDIDNGLAIVVVTALGNSDSLMVDVCIDAVSNGEQVIKMAPLHADGAPGTTVTIPITDARPWSPDEPWLYHGSITLRDGQRVVDRVTTYFGMRKIEVAKAPDGRLRLMLNNKPLFQYGPLDQGWWPDGLYRAPTDEALRYDLEVTKKLGFNMIRKHVKVEPERWYYHCDRLGLMVWQDMPSGDQYIGPNCPDLVRTPESATNFRREYQAMIDGLGNHPCIVAWVPFNEGWGQFDTNKILAWTKKHDPTRLVDAPSGWADRGSGDLRDTHRYPGPAMAPPKSKRAVVLGEFGGLGLPVEGHLWWNKRNWGYRGFKSREELQQGFERLIEKLRPLIGRGLAAAVYTQTTDVEGEVNGLMTYDRAMIKYDADRLAEIHQKLYLPPPLYRFEVIVPTSEEQGQAWRYRTRQPNPKWFEFQFDDSAWNRAPGGFGQKGTPDAVVRTIWTSKDIWLRRPFQLADTNVASLHLRIHHDEDAEVWLNGTKIAELKGYVGDYEEINIAKAARLLRKGKNVLAIHCHQTTGGQYIDAGLVDVEELPSPSPPGK